MNRHNCWVSGALVVVFMGLHDSARAVDPPATAPAAIWLTDRPSAYRDAALHKRPILLVYGAEWCAPCRELARQMDRPEISAKLASWTLLHLDVDHLDGADRYVGGIPALRILDSQGKAVAGREGFLKGEELLAWLDAAVPTAAPPDPDLADAEHPPDAATAGRLVTKLVADDALAREKAIRRLAPWPGAAAAPVAELFATGNLQTRLAAIELLQAWKAPVDGIDPWTPTTITPERIATLRQWAKTQASATTRPASTSQTIDGGEIAALLRAESSEEARVITLRLSRAGRPLLPTVADRIRQASSDTDIERLTTLRYTIVADDALNTNWPGGLERLASRDAQTRHAAAGELAQRATPADGPLLIELFADPDPLMREIGLRALQTVGGPDASREMLTLLHDPDPNVRAAVLKELAEAPSPAMVADVMQYIATEKDPDLVVHAVRVLRAAQTPAAEKCLLGLFADPSWRVRAEAVDALSESRQKRARSDAGKQDESNGPGDEQLQRALIKLMDDPDGFVAGQAVAAIQKISGQLGNLQLMIEASKRHPSLALDVIRALARQGSSDVNAIRSLRAFCSNPDASIRVAALDALVKAVPADAGGEIITGLNDRAAEVRATAGDAVFQAIQATRPQDGYVERPAFLGLFGGGRVKVDPAQWLEDFRSGKGCPAWMKSTIAPLQKMMADGDDSQKFIATFPLVAFGRDAEAMPVVMKLIRSDLARRDTACWLLPWLPWAQRIEFFNALLNMEGGINNSILGHLAEQMAVWQDPRAAESLWRLLQRSDADAILPTVSEALRNTYTGGEHVNPETQTNEQKSTIELLKTKSADGPAAQRVAAMAILLALSQPEAATIAGNVYKDDRAPIAVREAAFHILLQSQQPASTPAAVSGLSSTDGEMRNLSLRFLAAGADGLGELQSVPWLHYGVVYSVTESVESGQPVSIQAPAGLTADPLTPIVKSGDDESAALAGYLLCLLHDKSGLDPLLKFWRAKGDDRGDEETKRMVYRAISALDDDSQTPVLSEIYASYKQESYYVREFYWTIRGMHGANIMALRKKIRDEIGMEQLK